MDKPIVNVTVTMTPAERKALKQIALDRDTTVSALIREWISQNTDDKRNNNK